MTWSDWLAALPFFQTRRALAEATRELEDGRDEIRQLRLRIRAQKERLAAEKRKRRQLERRMAGSEPSSGTRPLLVFDHIPKTAGTTFRRSYLTTALPPGERWILAGGERNEHDRERFLALQPAARARLRIVAGHGAEALRPHLPEARFITVVRDPLERAISSYLHAMLHAGGEQLWADVRARRLTLGQFVEQYYPPDQQSRTLLGEDYETLDEEQIRRRLKARYVLVGYTEAFDEFVYLLHVTEDLPLCMYRNRLVREERRRYVASDADLEAVRRSNGADALLHRVVREEFQARVEALPAAMRAAMCRYLEALETFRATASREASDAARDVEA